MSLTWSGVGEFVAAVVVVVVVEWSCTIFSAEGKKQDQIFDVHAGELMRDSGYH